jgi:hypothetical protein
MRPIQIFTMKHSCQANDTCEMNHTHAAQIRQGAAYQSWRCSRCTPTCGTSNVMIRNGVAVRLIESAADGAIGVSVEVDDDDDDDDDDVVDAVAVVELRRVICCMTNPMLVSSNMTIGVKLDINGDVDADPTVLMCVTARMRCVCTEMRSVLWVTVRSTKALRTAIAPRSTSSISLENVEPAGRKILKWWNSNLFIREQ